MRTTRAAVTRDLLSGLPESGASVKTLAAGAVLLKGFAATEAPALLKALERVLAEAPFRHMVTPSGHTMWRNGDRKSTRLNSSHGYISYAVFCLKKKKHKHPAT